MCLTLSPEEGVSAPLLSVRAGPNPTSADYWKFNDQQQVLSQRYKRVYQQQ